MYIMKLLQNHRSQVYQHLNIVFIDGMARRALAAKQSFSVSRIHRSIHPSGQVCLVVQRFLHIRRAE